MSTTCTISTTAALALSGALLLGACGDDGDATAETPAATEAGGAATDSETDAGDAATDDVIEIAMTDFSYGGLPSELPAGTRIAVTNTSDVEIHEFVAFRLDDGDERPVEDVVESDLERLLTETQPTAVMLAAPGGEQINAVGDGTFSEPGRYVVVCVIPTGADPAEYPEAAATGEGPPQVEGGAAHVADGMFADFAVGG